jgi:hypothetical protein
VIGSHAFDAVKLLAQNILSMRVDHVICCNLHLCLQEGDLTAQEKLLVGIPIRNKNKTISEKISRNIFKLIWAQWFSSTVLTLASQIGSLVADSSCMIYEQIPASTFQPSCGKSSPLFASDNGLSSAICMWEYCDYLIDSQRHCLPPWMGVCCDLPLLPQLA